MASGTIQEGDWAVVFMMDDRISIVRIAKGEIFKGIKNGPQKGVDLGSVVGLRWNEPIGFDSDRKIFCKKVQGGEAQKELVGRVVREGTEAGSDNRNLLDKNSAQTLTKDELHEKRDGGKGLEIVEDLIANSKTFSAKSKFSQEKYIKKKSKKYDFSMRLRRPTLDSIIETYLLKKPEKIMHIRSDTLSQILTLANVGAGNNTIVIDGLTGLLSAATVLRQGGLGRVYNLIGTLGKGVHTSMVYDWLSLNEKAATSLVNFDYQRDFATELKEAPTTPFTESDDVEATQVRDYRTHLCTKKAVHEMRYTHGVDSVVIASQHDPRESFFQILPLMGGSCTFCVYSRYIEPLLEISKTLRGQSIAVNVQLSETWFRPYQVLPDRTHPAVNMSATGGYLLSGSIMENAHPRSFWSITDTFSAERNKTEIGLTAQYVTEATTERGDDGSPPTKKQRVE